MATLEEVPSALVTAKFRFTAAPEEVRACTVAELLSMVKDQSPEAFMVNVP